MSCKDSQQQLLTASVTPDGNTVKPSSSLRLWKSTSCMPTKLKFDELQSQLPGALHAKMA
eukprot:3956992-Amphidinium_carterae.1